MVPFLGNKYIIDLVRNHVMHGRIKRVELKFHFLIEKINKKVLNVIHPQLKSNCHIYSAKKSRLTLLKGFRMRMGN